MTMDNVLLLMKLLALGLGFMLGGGYLFALCLGLASNPFQSRRPRRRRQHGENSRQR